MAGAGDDPLSAALKMSFGLNGKNGSYFPGAQRYADDRSDLNDTLNQSPETQFLGKGRPAPTPTPTPPVKPSTMNLAQLYDHFGVEARVPTIAQVQPALPHPDHLEQMRAQYGWNT